MNWRLGVDCGDVKNNKKKSDHVLLIEQRAEGVHQKQLRCMDSLGDLWMIRAATEADSPHNCQRFKRTMLAFLGIVHWDITVVLSETQS